MGILSTRRVLAASGVLIAATVAGLWILVRRAPVEEARRFLTQPIELGEVPAAPATPASPAEVERRYEAASTAFEDGRYAEAATEFAWVVAHDPTGPRGGPAQWNLTRSRLRSGDGMGALDALDDLLRHQAGYLEAEVPLLHDGLEKMQRGDLEAAAAAFAGMIREQPHSEFVPLAHALRARIHWVHGEPMATVEEFGRMFRSVRDPVPGYATLAQQLERYADGDETVADSLQRLAEDGEEEFRDIYQYLAARALLEQDHFEATRDALELLRERHPGGDFSHIVDLEHAWNLLRHQKAAEALAVFERLRETPAPAEARAFDRFFDLRAELPMGIARCHMQLGNWEQAVASFEEALAAAPSIYDVENRVSLAIAYERLGRFDDAARVLRDAINAHPDEPKLWAVRQQLDRIERQAAALR